MVLLQQPWEIKYSSYTTCEMLYHSKVVCDKLKILEDKKRELVRDLVIVFKYL